jgi:hypothetical protein
MLALRRREMVPVSGQDAGANIGKSKPFLSAEKNQKTFFCWRVR